MYGPAVVAAVHPLIHDDPGILTVHWHPASCHRDILSSHVCLEARESVSGWVRTRFDTQPVVSLSWLVVVDPCAGPQVEGWPPICAVGHRSGDKQVMPTKDQSGRTSSNPGIHKMLA
jgi:hypothetical protein